MKFRFFFVFAVLVNAISFSQTNDKIEFPSVAIYEDYSDSIKNVTDAVNLFSSDKFFLYMDKEFDAKMVTHKKIKLLTEKGIEDYGKIIIRTEYVHNNYDLKVRVIKQNGTFRSVGINELIRQQNCSALSCSNFRIPNLNINDEIEYILEERFLYSFSDTKFCLYSAIPTKNSNLSFIINNDYNSQMKFYNGFPEPSIIKIKHNGINATNYSWNVRNVPGSLNEENVILGNILPYVYFAVHLYRSQFGSVYYNTWNRLLKDIFNGPFSDIALGSMKNIILKTTGTDGLKDDNSKLNAIVKLHSLINDSIEFAERTEDRLEGHSLEYFINNKKINFSYLKTFYNTMFSYLGITAEHGIARNKSNGEIDSTFASPEMIDELFYKFSIDGIEYYMFIKNKATSYALNEIPVEVQGTIAYLFNKTPKAKKIIYLPIIDKSFNSKTVKTIITIKTEDDEVTAKAIATYSGNCATDERTTSDYFNYRHSENCYIDRVIEQFNLGSMDSLRSNRDKKNSPPYLFNMTYTFKPDKPSISKVAENNYKIQLNHLISNNTIKADSYGRLFDYDIDYLYTDNTKCYLSFDKNVEVQNPEQKAIKISNDFGNYLISVTQINPSTILVNSTYDINKMRLPKEKYYLVKELYDAYLKAISDNLDVKILN
jgi:hypothetical protein